MSNASDSRDPSSLRSARWFRPDDLRSFGHRSRLKGMGFDDADFRDRPIIALLNTWSDLNTCHSHFRERTLEIKRGVLQAGGFPVEIPVLSLSEMLMKPTTMLYRNLLAMETEEVLRAHPVDACVLMGGCDKTVPAMLMGAISADIPSIFFPAGPMLNARWRNTTLGSGTDAWKYWNERCAGNLCDGDWQEIENCIARSAGTCMTMGTASTMACIAESLGFTLPRASSIPAVVAEHSRLAVSTGRTAVELAWNQRKPSRFLRENSFRNAMTVQLAIGGSTNAMVHMIAMSRRAGFPLTLRDYDQLSRQIPVIANIRPSGKYLMEDFHRAGGLPGLIRQLGELFDLNSERVDGTRFIDDIPHAMILDDDVLRAMTDPVYPNGGTCVLYGNLAPEGCVIKSSAASKELLKHRGQAVVFRGYADLKARIHSEDLQVAPESILVLQDAGPIGAPGMPEWGMLPIPNKLLRRGVRDMVRISDARMSGTSYGTCILHVSPESRAGGPLGLVQDGDWIELDVESRRIDWLVSPETVQQREANRTCDTSGPGRGYTHLFTRHVTQAHQGCDFDFLEGRDPGREPDIF
ncbi:MAG: dihydroxy-acid dehydratase [Pirellula sp.]|nr:dihydroxy-acid dehydratase [Pirellula sp.]